MTNKRSVYPDTDAIFEGIDEPAEQAKQIKARRINPRTGEILPGDPISIPATRAVMNNALANRSRNEQKAAHLEVDDLNNS